jgi:hypothetical protein
MSIEKMGDGKLGSGKKTPYDRYNPDISGAQSKGPEIELKESEVALVKEFIKKGSSPWQRAFRVVMSDNNLFIDPYADFSGNILECIDQYSNDIYEETGVRFCYHPVRHNIPSAKMNDDTNRNIAQFILIPTSLK